MLKIIIPLNPVTKKNSQRIVRCGGFTKILPSKAYCQYEKDCGYFLKGFKPIKEKVNVKALYYRATRHRVDLCNLHEALCDVLVTYGVVEDDNVNIIATMDGSKVLYDKQNPRTEIIITKIEEKADTTKLP